MNVTVYHSHRAPRLERLLRRTFAHSLRKFTGFETLPSSSIMAHSHNCNGECDHNHDDPAGDSLGVEYSLFMKIDLERVECLNEVVDGSGKSVFKPWENRMDTDKVSNRNVNLNVVANVLMFVVH